VSVKKLAAKSMATYKWRISKQYRYACACGCESIVVSLSKRKADADGFNGSVEDVWVISNEHKVLADTYSLEDAQYVLRRIEGKL
jgi:O-glycosyl hydrolase